MCIFNLVPLVLNPDYTPNEVSYEKLHEYTEEIKDNNPGTIASCISQYPNDATLFKRIFISFDPMIIGFIKDYRPFVEVDGCYLKGLL